MFKEKLEYSIYKEILAKYAKTMEKGFDKFKELSLDEKAVQIYELLKMFQCTPETSDLLRIGGKKNAGALRLNMDITNKKNLAIIHQSVTGIYEKIERIN